MAVVLRLENNPGDGDLHGVIVVDGEVVASCNRAHVLAGMLYALRVQQFEVETYLDTLMLDTMNPERSEREINRRLLHASSEPEWRLAADAYLTLCELHERGGEAWARPVLREAAAEVQQMSAADAARFTFPPGL